MAKILLVMRLIVVLLTTAILQVSAAGYAQKISLSKKSAPLIGVFNDIRNQSGYDFVFTTALLESAKPVSINVKNTELKEVLDKIFENQPLTYTIEDKTVVVSKKESSLLDKVIARFQAIDVRGKVVDEQNQPLAGASVTVKGKNQQTKTDAQGNFYLQNVDEKATLVISFVGFKTTEVSVKEDLGILTLKLEDNSLEQVQVIAYGEVQKKFSTSNIGSVNAKTIENQPITNPLLALQGRVAGLFILQSSGVSGASVNVTVQGQNSLKKGNVPFYVIDGVPYEPNSLMSRTTPGVMNGAAYSNLSFINPADIESIDVLKDADATAIYGSRAANGAILITTKKGKAGQTKVDLNLQTGWGKVAKTPNMLTGSEYLELRRETYQNGQTSPSTTDYDVNGVWDSSRDVNWQKELVGSTAQYQNLQASVSGGSDKTQFLAGAGYLRETPVFLGNFSNVKTTVRFNVNHASQNNKFRFFLSGKYLQGNNQLPTVDFSEIAATLSPNAPDLYKADGTLNWSPLPTNPNILTFINPAANLLTTYSDKARNLIANSNISYEVIPGLSLKSTFGYNRLASDELVKNPMTSKKPDILPIRNSASYSNKSIETWIIEPQLTFNKTFAFGAIDALLGSTFQQTNSNLISLSGVDYASDAQLSDLNSAGTKSVDYSLQSTYRYSAIFGRLNYRYKDRYIINLSARRDGSSRFGSQNLFHSFYSVGGAWLFTEENFIKNTIPALNYGKLRASYGTTGNDQIGDYEFYSLYNPYSVGVNILNTTGLKPRGLSNAYLEWEETRKLNLGIDLGFFDNRILVNANYFRNRSSNQLLNQNLSVVTGFGSIVRNLPATVQNTGWEFTLDYEPVRGKAFTWQGSANITIPKNKLVRYDGLETSTDRNAYVIGQPITIRKFFNYAGVNPQTGLYQFLNAKGELTSTPSDPVDRTALINTDPKWYGGISNTFNYKGFSLDVFFQFVKQKSLAASRFGSFPGISYNKNQPDVVLNRWRKPGDEGAEIQKVTSNFIEILFTSLNASSSSGIVSDGTFVRLKNASLSYTLNNELTKRVHISNARFFVQGQNLLTWTNFFGGLDPEIRGGQSTLGTLRMITLGTQLTF
ncbi:SusC/RagA family TonB-linked outer membrane protein [Pedobacter faecalis]|uniref:SusC/RagA family TonB-linked outer membrane protein n=1 Tax=Pedobacter faecalis TaxID=3041495 RepID=UPI0025511ECB|nr:SusC/RagA family TonB-linked outer membrane protein [Pedobacter sp. ELA7]